MRRHQKHTAKKAQHAATGQHGKRCEYNSTRCDDDDEKTAPQMVRGAGHTFLFAFWLSTHFAGVCRSFPELPYHRHHPTATGIAVAANDAPLTKHRQQDASKNLAKQQRKETGTRTGPMQESRQEIMTKSGETKLDAASHNGLEPALGHSAFNTTQIQKSRIPIPMTNKSTASASKQYDMENERDTDQDKGK